MGDGVCLQRACCHLPLIADGSFAVDADVSSAPLKFYTLLRDTTTNDSEPFFGPGRLTKKKHLNVIYYLNSDTNCLALRIKLAASPATQQRAFVLVAFRLR